MIGIKLIHLKHKVTGQTSDTIIKGFLKPPPIGYARLCNGMIEKEVHYNDQDINPVQASSGNEITQETKEKILRWKERMAYKTYKDIRMKKRNEKKQ